MDGTLAPGEQVRDADIAQWLGVSRTPVREALLELAHAGLVQTTPGRATIISPIERRATSEARDVVAAMHRLAALAAVPRLDSNTIERMRAANRLFAAALRCGDIDGAIAETASSDDALVVKLSVGVVIGLFSYIRAGLVPLIAAIFPIPKIALLPLFVIWFGIDEASKYALIAFGTFTPTVVATYGAVDNVDRSLIRMGQSFGLSWFSIVRKIVLPGAMPGILSGLRISLAIAIILLVAAEMLGAQYGIGAYILEAGSLYDLERLFAGVVILSLLGVIVSAVIGLIERRVLGWRS